MKPRRVKAHLGKKLHNINTGEVLYFIDKDHGIKRKLTPYMNFRTTLPNDPDFCQINLILKLV